MGNLLKLLGKVLASHRRAFVDGSITRDFDIGDTIQCLRYYAGWADKIVGQVSPTVNDNPQLRLCG